jgi:hypothetical protein
VLFFLLFFVVIFFCPITLLFDANERVTWAALQVGPSTDGQVGSITHSLASVNHYLPFLYYQTLAIVFFVPCLTLPGAFVVVGPESYRGDVQIERSSIETYFSCFAIKHPLFIPYQAHSLSLDLKPIVGDVQIELDFDRFNAAVATHVLLELTR